MVFHTQSKEDLENTFEVAARVGLSQEQVAKRLLENGENRLAAKKKRTWMQRFLLQFKDVMIIILLIAALISFGLAIYDGSAEEFFEPALILLIVIVNAIMGVIQESKAEKALDSLMGMSIQKARVLRGGVESVIDSAGLVVGDIILLEAGDFVPADARLLRSSNLKSEESALTGESVPSEKDARAVVAEKAPLGDRSNMVFSGCSITYGTGIAMVVATGMNTQMGKIAGLLSGEVDTQTPLQRKLASLGKYLGIAALAACLVIFIVGLIKGNQTPIELFMVAVSLAVSAIPEGLPAIVTIVLSIGVQRMVKRNAIIRRLPAVETLGSASVICSDKTGTLTQNRMTLTEAWADGMEAPEKIDISCQEPIATLLKYGSLCCDGSVVFVGNDVTHIGDPTETAIVFAAHRNGMPKDEINRELPRVAELPFDSDRKRMTSINRMPDGKYLVIVKGAFDGIAPLCIKGDVGRAETILEDMSQRALRVLAVAFKIVDSIPLEPTMEQMERDLNLLGLVGMIDPPREEARVAVATCKEAGIKVVMITGDHVVTATAIARELGIFEQGDESITGAELAAMSDDELDARVEHISVYARVSPEDKIRIIKAWQRKEKVVSMTGDGVNDAPALKAADIGCAMGITGTDVAKGASDMTLTDDNFATIVHAVKEGRGIYDNIKKVVGFLLGTNIGEVLVVFFAMIIWGASPLLSMQLLWINLVTDSLPAIALGREDVDPRVMHHLPKPKGESIFAHGLGIKVALQGVMFALITLGMFLFAWNTLGNLEAGRTMAFLTLSMLQVIHAFNMRSDHSLFASNPFGNRSLNIAVLISTLMIWLVLVVPPIQTVFGLVALPLKYYLIGIAASLIPVPIMELAKAVGIIKPKGHKQK
ncbi:MAG: cation-translocating P-type ATPase [Eubacteriales bacterium]|nr:cation-translocating P-type ATPase [Eubacteriales bacterium]